MTEPSIPPMLVALRDQIASGLADEAREPWLLRFSEATRGDLSRMSWRFLHWLITDERACPGINHPEVKAAVAACADVLVAPMNGLPINEEAGEAARAAARAAGVAEAEAGAYVLMSEKLLLLMQDAETDHQERIAMYLYEARI